MDNIVEGVNKRRFGQALFVFIIVLTVFVAVLAINGIKENRYIGGYGGGQSTITVNGEGEAFATPDIATFTFTITEEASTVADAQKRVVEQSKDAVDFLKDSGVKEKDIKTQYFNIYPRYEFRRQQIFCVTFPCPQPPGERVLTGYEVSEQIQVKIRDIDDAGAILTGLGELGVDNLNGPNFTVEDEDNVVGEAREMAIEDAQEKAKRLAKDLDVKLVRVLYFSESGPGFPRYYAESAAFGLGGDGAIESQQVPAKLSPGENRFVSNVSITYEIR